MTTTTRSYGSQVLRAGLRRTLKVQASLTALVTLLFQVWKGPFWGAAAVYGGILAMVVAILLAWRVGRAAELAGDSQQGALQLYLGAAERFLIVGIGFAAGIAWLALPPVAMIVGFAAAQLSFFWRLSTRLEDRPKAVATDNTRTVE